MTAWPKRTAQVAVGAIRFPMTLTIGAARYAMLSGMEMFNDPRRAAGDGLLTKQPLPRQRVYPA